MTRIVAVAAVLAIACAQPEPDAHTADVALPDTVSQKSPAAAARAAAPPASPDRSLLLGAWSADGENFTWVIDSTTILFEIDMREHPYTLRGDTLVIDREDPTVGIQRTRAVRVTADTLLIEDVQTGSREALVRLR